MKWIMEDNAAGEVTTLVADSHLEACQLALDRLNVAIWDKDDYDKLEREDNQAETEGDKQ